MEPDARADYLDGVLKQKAAAADAAKQKEEAIQKQNAAHPNIRGATARQQRSAYHY